MDDVTEGWAGVIKGRIEVRTVSPTQQAAMVNALWCFYRYKCLNSHTYEDIKKQFDEEVAGAGVDVKVVQVEIRLRRARYEMHKE